MDTKTYLRESERTAAGHYHGSLVSPPEMDYMLQAVIAAGGWADRVKRALFYGKEITGNRIWSITSLAHDPDLMYLVHAVLGSITESAEMAEHLRDVLTHAKPLDKVNVLEEIGDLLWYQAMALRFLDSDFEAAFAANIAKLRARFPDKFTEEAALARDLEAERAVLETSVVGLSSISEIQSALESGAEFRIETSGYAHVIATSPIEPEHVGLVIGDRTGRTKPEGFITVADNAAENIKLQNQYSIAISVLDRIMVEATTVQEAKRWAFEVLKPWPAEGSKWVHRNGTAYTVLHLANAPDDERYPATVVYQGPNGAVWARRADDWHRSMTCVKDMAQGTSEE